MSDIFTAIVVMSWAGISASVDVTYESIDASKFPFVFNTLSVRVDGQPTDALDVSHFTVTEDGRVQTDYLEVIPPSQSGGSRLADVVFLIDNSGSMGNEIAAVRNNVNAFAESTNAAFIEVSKVTQRVGEIVRQIAAASNEQADGINHVKQVVTDMDQIIQQNSVSAENSF